MGIFHTIKPDSGLVPIREVYVLLPQKMKQPLYTDRKKYMLKRNVCFAKCAIFHLPQLIYFLNF